MSEPLEGFPVCPECGSATFWNNTDGYQTIFCINENCKWKQQIRSRPHPTPTPQQHTECYIDGYKDGARKARKAREDFIDEAITQCEWDGPITQEDVWRKLESLRTQQQAGDPK